MKHMCLFGLAAIGLVLVSCKAPDIDAQLDAYDASVQKVLVALQDNDIPRATSAITDYSVLATNLTSAFQYASKEQWERKNAITKKAFSAINVIKSLSVVGLYDAAVAKLEASLGTQDMQAPYDESSLYYNQLATIYDDLDATGKAKLDAINARYTKAENSYNATTMLADIKNYMDQYAQAVGGGDSAGADAAAASLKDSYAQLKALGADLIPAQKKELSELEKDTTFRKLVR